MTIVKGKPMEQWIREFPDLGPILNYTPFYWSNPNVKDNKEALQDQPLQLEDMKDAEERLKRFAPFIARPILKRKRMGELLNPR